MTEYVWPWLRGGLSPRVRGNHPGLDAGLPGAGSIPACAGEPCLCRHRRHRFEVYPRVCGGTSPAGRDVVTREGLSPRVRGNLGRWLSTRTTTRSIPACAGEPRTAPIPHPVRKVYPRVCGGTPSASPSNFGILGLSPRVRGNQTQAAAERERAGSIPACAGEPSARGRMSLRWRVYPRVCGGTKVDRGDLRSAVGLSPRVRGNHGERRIRARLVGSIPACAGEPVALSEWEYWTEVYPRVCGGTDFGVGDTWTTIGLSPRVRGNLPAFLAVAARRGSIPACAGEPSGDAPL